MPVSTAPLRAMEARSGHITALRRLRAGAAPDLMTGNVTPALLWPRRDPWLSI
jgi:hypothetical protein